MYGYGEPQEIFPCIRSLRTTGSRCQIIVIVDGFSVSPLFRDSFFNDCGVQIFFFNQTIKTTRPIRHYKWVAFRDYLLNISQANRVFLSDTDVVMQEDPFSTYINQWTENDLYLVRQTYTYNHSSVDSQWANMWYMPERGDSALDAFRFNMSVNSGSVFGSYKAVLVTCNEMATRFFAKLDSGIDMARGDQGILINIVFSNFFHVNNITPHYFYSDVGPYIFASLHFKDPYPNVTYSGPHKFFYVHHLTNTNQAASIRPMCPRISRYDTLKGEAMAMT